MHLIHAVRIYCILHEVNLRKKDNICLKMHFSTPKVKYTEAFRIQIEWARATFPQIKSFPAQPSRTQRLE
jgi:hypothetical protein